MEHRETLNKIYLELREVVKLLSLTKKYDMRKIDTFSHSIIKHSTGLDLRLRKNFSLTSFCNLVNSCEDIDSFTKTINDIYSLSGGIGLIDIMTQDDIRDLKQDIKDELNEEYPDIEQVNNLKAIIRNSKEVRTGLYIFIE